MDSGERLALAHKNKNKNRTTETGTTSGSVVSARFEAAAGGAVVLPEPRVTSGSTRFGVLAAIGWAELFPGLLDIVKNELLDRQRALENGKGRRKASRGSMGRNPSFVLGFLRRWAFEMQDLHPADQDRVVDKGGQPGCFFPQPME